MHLLRGLLAAPDDKGTNGNPISGLAPDFSIFGAEFTSWWQKLFAAVWALALLVSIVMLLRALVGMLENRGNHPGALKESRTSAVHSAVVLSCVAGFGVLVGAILQVAG